MKFARFSIYHPRNFYKVDENGASRYNNDEISLNFIPAPFYAMLDSAYKFDDHFFAESILPDEFDSQNDSEKELILMHMAAAGFVDPSFEFNFQSHETFAKKIL